MTRCDARRRELGRCLRAHRDLVAPGRVGLPDTGRRRAPGLRREEVATLAGVGVTWYTWLEQGRVTASDQVLDAVGRVLGIDAAGREHLRALSRPADVSAPEPASARLRPLLASWRTDPAALLDARLDVLAVNGAWAGVWERSEGHHVLAPLVAGLPVDARPADASPLVHALARRLRMASDRDPGDERLARIRAGLHAIAPGLAALWECRGVGAFGCPRVSVGGTERVAHLLGEPGAPEPTLLVLVRSGADAVEVGT